MKKLLVMLAMAMVLTMAVTPVFAGGTLNGAGATFPYPLYSK